MIIDGSACYLMLDDDANSDIGWYQWAGNICPVDSTIGRAESVLSWSVGQKVYFLSRPVGGFGVSDDDEMISMADPWRWRRSTDIMPQKSDFEKITGAKRSETRKIPGKVGFQENFGGLDPYGRRRPWGFCAFFGRRPVAVSWPFLGLFQFCFLLYFSLIFLLIYWLDSTEENPSKSHENHSTKFPIFGKAENFVADFPPRVETRSNDVGMT